MNRVRRMAVALGLGLQPVTILCEVVAAAASRAPYSFAHNTISDLGATTCTDIAYPFGPVPVCSPLHAVVNGGFVLGGVLLVVGVLAARPLLPRGPMREVGAWALVVAGVSSGATGLVPLDVDVPLHYLVSLPVFVAQPLGLLAWGWALRPEAPAWLGRVGIATGLLCLAATVMFLVLEGQPQHLGTLERLALWPALGWFGAVGVALTRRVRR